MNGSGKGAKAQRKVTFLALGWLILVGLPIGGPFQSSGVTVVRNQAAVEFPETVTFQLAVDRPGAITAAVLTYDVETDDCLAASTQVPVTVAAGTTEISWTWVMSRSGNPPPGARLWWEWTLTDPNGATLTTPRQGLTFSDDRFDWRTAEAEGIRLHWYAGEEVGPLLLAAAVSGLERLQADMGIELQREVQFYIYGSAEDMRQAVLYIQDWAGGVAFTEYNTILIGVPPAIVESWGARTVRHELAHLVTAQFGRSCLGGGRPTWLEEGLAVYAEGDPDPAVLADLERAIAEDNLSPVRSLNGAFPAHDQAAGIAYSQSYSLVAFLLEQYGREKMQELLLTLAAGEGYDDALEMVYGFNADGLEVAWRKAIGAPARVMPPTPTPLVAAAIPTAGPLRAPQSLPTPAGLPTTGPTAEEGSPGLCGLALAPLFLLVWTFWTRMGRTNGLRPTVFYGQDAQD
ncbi:MAG: peptidase MA family metallohydrolase [Chloroflexota bacterium]